jgi:serine/threonine protein kinase
VCASCARTGLCGGQRAIAVPTATAQDTRLHRTVAVKVLPAHLAARTEARERFEREARAISSLNHPHICSLYDIGSQDGIDFLVME